MAAEELAVIDSHATVTETALTLPEQLSHDEWADIGEKLGRAHKASAWWIGDWINHGERKWGEIYAEAERITGLSYPHLTACSYVARRFQSHDRSSNLKWSHYYRAKALADAEEWLAKAEEEGWSVANLVAAIRGEDVPPRNVYVINNGKSRQIAEAHARRVSSGLASISGYCDGLSQLKLERAIAGASPDDIKSWKKLAGEAAKQLNALRRALKEVQE